MVGKPLPHDSSSAPSATRPATVYLSTPCATPACGHAYNCHTSGGCTVETCGCVAFATGSQVSQ